MRSIIFILILVSICCINAQNDDVRVPSSTQDEIQSQNRTGKSIFIFEPIRKKNNNWV